MKHQKLAAVIAAVAVLGLAGCSAPEAAPAPTETVYVTMTPEDPGTTPAPAEATPESADPLSDDEAAAKDALIRLQLVVDSAGFEVTADQVKAAADYTCDQLDAGSAEAEIAPITGGVDAATTESFVFGARDLYCPVR